MQMKCVTLKTELIRCVIRAVVFVPQYVTQTVEVESADSQRSLTEMQTKNAALQEQLSVQRQLLRELETQLHESQRTCAQLRTQVTPAVTAAAAVGCTFVSCLSPKQ